MGPSPALAAVKARQSAMTLYSFNLGLLGGMAKGDIEYDADAASAAQTSQIAPEAKAISARIATPETFRTARPAPSPRKLYKKP